MKKEQTQKILLLALLIVGVGYTYYSYLFLPQWTQIQKLTNSISERQDHYKQLVILQQHQLELQEKAQLIAQQVKDRTVQVPEQINKPELALKFYNLANQYAISAQNFNYGAIQNKEGYQQIELTFTGVGTLPNVEAMLKDVLNGTPVFAIESVNLTNQKGLTNCTLKVLAFAVPPGNVSTQLKLNDLKINLDDSGQISGITPGLHADGLSGYLNEGLYYFNNFLNYPFVTYIKGLFRQ